MVQRKAATSKRKQSGAQVPGWLREIRGRAKRCLAELRSGRGHTGMIKAFYFSVERGWYDLEMIGTNYEEIHALEQGLRLRMMQEDIAKLRRGEVGAVPLFRIREAQKIGVELAQAGTTEEELQSLIAGNTPRPCVDCPLISH